MYNSYSIPDDFQVHALQYRHPSSGAGMCQCVAVGMAVAAVAYLLLKESQPAMPLRGSTMAMLSGISARLADVVGGVDAADAKTTQGIPRGVATIVDAPRATADKDDWKKMSPAAKKDAEARVRAFLGQNPTAVLMIFAPWCPHCSNAMPTFAECAQRLSSRAKFMLVNAEALPTTAFSGEGAIVPIQYFPTFVAKQPAGGVQVVDTLDSLDSMLAAAPTPAPAPAPAPAAADDTQEMLKLFF